MIINFDNAATTFPKPLSVRKAVAEALEKYGGNAGRGGHALAMLTSEAVYSARETAAAFFGAEPENTVFTLNCTHALNMAIQGVMSDGGHMIISGLEHNSSSRPAARLAQTGQVTLSVAEIFPETEKTVESFRRLIRRNTRAIVCTIASNVTGQILPWREIGELCRENNICFIADGAQACGIIDIKMKDGINILCTAGHKALYGIAGTGLLITDGKYAIPPIIRGGTGSASDSLIQPELLPEALESGTINTPGIMSLKSGIEFINHIGLNKISSYEDSLCRRFISGIKDNKKIVVYRKPNASYVPIVSFNTEGMHPEKAASELAKKGFCLRAGFHCAALAHAQLGTESGTVRFAPSVFSRMDDVERLIGLVNAL